MRSARLLTCAYVASRVRLMGHCSDFGRSGGFGGAAELVGDGRFLRTREVADLLHVASHQTVINYFQDGLLRATRTKGGHRRYERASVDELIAMLALEDPGVRAAGLESLRRHNRGESPPTAG